MEQPVNVRLRDFSELLGQFDLDRVPPDAVVLVEQVVQQPTMLREEKTQIYFQVTFWEIRLVALMPRVKIRKSINLRQLGRLKMDGRRG